MNFRASVVISLCLFVLNGGNAECNDSSPDWTIEWVGRSTKFRLENECEDRTLTVSMSSLTEYGADGKMTSNKVTSFASSKDWLDGSTQEYQGSDIIYNKFEADSLRGVDAGLVLETRYFRAAANITDPDGNKKMLPADSIKFDVGVTGWTYLDPDNSLTLCIDLKSGDTNSTSGSEDGDDEEEGDKEEVTDSIVLEGFEIDNVMTAECVGSSSSEDMNVTITMQTSGNKLTLCYEFAACDGDISYDPFITPLGAGNDTPDQPEEQPNDDDGTSSTSPPNTNDDESAVNMHSVNKVMLLCLMCIVHIICV